MLFSAAPRRQPGTGIHMQSRMMRLFLVFMLIALFARLSGQSVRAANSDADSERVGGAPSLSPIWPPSIQRWSSYIGTLSQVYGLDPDFIAAVIRAESNGDQGVISGQGAVGLMGVMPASPGLEWRPPAEELINPAVNLRWGVSILAEIIRQSGGDLFAALAAYSGGWDQVDTRVPQEYAAAVLDGYGRAVAMRADVSPDIAERWTIAIEVRHGHIPNQTLLVLGNDPASGLQTYGGHLVYAYTDKEGHTFAVRGYAVPLSLVNPAGETAVRFGPSDALEPELLRQSGSSATKISSSNPSILMACLPSLSRLRGHTSTRWFAPSSCPSWHR